MTSRRAGFTLIEMMTVVIIIAILYTGVPDVITQLQGPRNRRAYSEAANLSAALWGPTPDYQGFIGDIGLPTSATDPSYMTTSPNSLAGELVFPSTSTSFATPTNALGVTVGWNGPYAGFDLTGLLLDPWGQPWQVTTTGQIHSYGPDGVSGAQYSSDDIYLPVTGPMVRGAATGTITVTVRDVDGTQIVTGNAVKIAVWEPNPSSTPRGQALRRTYTSAAGASGSQPLTFDSVTAHAFVLSSIPPGRRAIEVYGTNDQNANCDGYHSGASTVGGSCQGLYGHGVVNVLPGGVSAIEIRLREGTNSAGSGG